MININTENKVELGIPPAFSERCAVAITEHKFGPNSKGDPMITIMSELAGYFGDDGQLKTEMLRGGTLYKIAGLNLRPTMFTLTTKAIGFYASFYRAATGTELTSIDETNPDTSYLDKLVMQALVSGSMDDFRKQLTDEEKAEGKKLGDPILGDDGKPIKFPKLQINGKNGWLKPFTGELMPY